MHAKAAGGLWEVMESNPCLRAVGRLHQPHCTTRICFLESRWTANQLFLETCSRAVASAFSSADTQPLRREVMCLVSEAGAERLTPFLLCGPDC